MKLIHKNLGYLLNELFESIIMIDADLKVLEWNHSTASLLGILRDDAISKNIFDLIPSLQKECEYYFKEAILNHHRTIEILSYDLIKPKSGKSIKVQAKFIPVFSEDEKTKRIVIVFKTLAAQDEYLHLLESVILNSNDAILITKSEPITGSDSLKIIFANPAFTKMTGYGTQEILGHSPRILQGSDTSWEDVSYIKDKLKKWQKVNREILNYTKQGKKFWVELDIVPVKNQEGYYTHWTAIQRETTERRKRVEALRLLNQELEEKVKERTLELENFTYFLAHDLKHSVRMITSFIDLIKKQDNKFNKDTVEYFDFVQTGALSLHNMVTSLSELLILKRQELNFETRNILDVVELVQQNLINTINETKTSILVHEIPTVKIDFTLMVNVFQNLIGNAIKYAGERTPIITIDAVIEAKSINIRIKDNGIGFRNEEKEDLFELFNRSKSVKNTKGFGIGLYICAIIIEKHEGKIYIQSNKDRGSTIVMQLPYHDAS